MPSGGALISRAEAEQQILTTVGCDELKADRQLMGATVIDEAAGERERRQAGEACWHRINVG